MDFEETGIRYLAAASLQLWRENPAVWTLKHLFGISSYQVPAVARSIAIKDGLLAALHASDQGHGEDIALASYKQKLLGWKIEASSPEARTEEDNILPMFDGLVKEIQRRELFIRPLFFRLSKAVLVEGIEVPLLSVVDLGFENVQLLVKTTLRCPSAPGQRELAALAINALARHSKPAVLYATPKKVAWYEAGPLDLAIEAEKLFREARQLQTMILTARSREHMLAMLPINHSHFLWSDETRAAVESIINTATIGVERGFIRATGGGVPVGTSGDACRGLLPGLGSGDAEGELEW